MQVHDLETLPVYFDAVERGEKTFEVRRDDRGYQKGDTLKLRRFDPARDDPRHWAAFPIYYRSLERRILWILTGGQFGIEPGHVVLALGPVEPVPASPDPAEGGEGR